MSDTAAQDHGVTRPATSGDIMYWAYGRPYGDGPGVVLNLFASCSYGTGGWKIFFVGNGDGTYSLMEQVPGFVNQLVTYYVADYTTGAGLLNPPRSVTIRDASGDHQVDVTMVK